MMYLTLSQLWLLHQTVSGYSAAEAKPQMQQAWQSIDWMRAHRIVKSLQRRIVAAIKQGRWGKVKSLQWILTHSFSAKVLAIRRVTENTGSRTSGIDDQIWDTPQSRWKAIWRWCVRRHPRKSRKWVAKRDFTYHKGNRWTLFAKDNGTTYYLSKLATVPIRRHIKIKAAANPFTKEDEPIFEKHLQRKMLNTWRKRAKLISLFRRQSGKCPICRQLITKQSGWHIHHKLERCKGGKDSLDNLVMLHPNCHHQVHHWNIQFDGDVPKRASEHA
jgi:5-methylcytosine-specific restriction endonuclease McrA